MNTVAFLNILIIRPESLRRESSPKESPAPPARTGSQTAHRPERPETVCKPRFFANFWLHFIFGLFICIFYFWGICRVINKFATLPQDICIRNYGNEMLWSQANDRRRRRRRRCNWNCNWNWKSMWMWKWKCWNELLLHACNKVTAAFRRLWSGRAVPLKSPTTTTTRRQHNIVLHK